MRISRCICIVATLFTSTLLTSCFVFEKAEPGECIANVDCGAGACVRGECVTLPKDCKSVGAFADVTTWTFDDVDSIAEIHLTVDAMGAVHYCYSGYQGTLLVTRYGRQISNDEFDELDLSTEGGEKVRCGAIAMSSEGVPHVLSRTLPAIVYLKDGQWLRGELEGLQGLEGKGAVASPYTAIHLSPDTSGGMFVSMSLGTKTDEQPVYIASLNNGIVTELVNGWVEEGAGTVTGYAPQVFGTSQNVSEYLTADNAALTMQLRSMDGENLFEKEGFRPVVAEGTQGYRAVAYLDRNWFLKIDRLTSGFQEFAGIGRIEPAADLRGQIPWTMFLDNKNNAHILVEDMTQNSGSLSYRVVSSDGDVSDALVVSSKLQSQLPGMQHYAVGTDLCGRASVALTEYLEEIDVKTGLSTLRTILKLREER